MDFANFCVHTLPVGAVGSEGTTTAVQGYLTLCVVLTSVVAFFSGPLLGAMSDIIGRFPAVAFTRLRAWNPDLWICGLV